jgi:hypothetical protein
MRQLTDWKCRTMLFFRFKTDVSISMARPLACTILVALVSRAAAADPPVDRRVVDAKQMEAWWDDLEQNKVVATRALLKLGDQPQQTVAFLKGKLKPLKIDSGKVKALLLKLGNANEQVWKPAFEELEYFDPRLAIDLQELMDRITKSPARQRMVEVLSGRKAGSLAG